MEAWGVMRRTRRLVVTGRVAGLGFAVAALAAGCSATNPATIATPYTASDGTNADLTDAASGETVRLRNFLLVAAAKGATGVVAGAVANDGSAPVSVRITVVDVSDPAQPRSLGQATVEVAPGELAQIGPAGTTLDVPGVPVAPGQTLSVTASTSAGSAQFTLPVLAPVNEYATLTPTTTPAPQSS
jgi:hypothetical protein